MNQLLLVAAIFITAIVAPSCERPIAGREMTMQNKDKTLPDWKAWLSEWNDELLKQLEVKESKATIEKEIEAEALASKWLGYPGAKEEEIEGLENRLGKKLPPSFRALLKITNGFRQPGASVPRLFAVKEIDWLRVSDQTTIEMWKSNGLDDLSDTLKISPFDDAVFLLNPKVVSVNGEWEAIDFNPGGPSCERYSSLWDLLQAEQESFSSWMEYLTGHLNPEDDAQAILAKYPSLIKNIEFKMPPKNETIDASGSGWGGGVRDGLEDAKKRIVEIREKSSDPKIIRQRLRSLSQEFRKKSDAAMRALQHTGVYRNDRTNGIEESFGMASASIEWFLNESLQLPMQSIRWEDLKTFAITAPPLRYSSTEDLTAYVAITVDKRGGVKRAESVKDTKKLDIRLGDAAAKTLARWRFQPYKVGGEAVEVHSLVIVKSVNGKATF